MSEMPLTGIYFHYMNQNGNPVPYNFELIAGNIQKNYNVTVIGISKGSAPVDKNSFVKRIKSDKIERLIIAGQSPGEIKSFFSAVMLQSGKNPENILLVDFPEREVTESDKNAEAELLLSCSLLGISQENIGATRFDVVSDDTLIIGGGIAGIQAALEIANSNHKVFLLERTGTIGGHMAMFDKTFPTLDCAACFLTPEKIFLRLKLTIDSKNYPFHNFISRASVSTNTFFLN